MTGGGIFDIPVGGDGRLQGAAHVHSKPGRTARGEAENLQTGKGDGLAPGLGGGAYSDRELVACSQRNRPAGKDGGHAVGSDAGTVVIQGDGFSGTSRSESSGGEVGHALAGKAFARGGEADGLHVLGGAEVGEGHLADGGKAREVDAERCGLRRRSGDGSGDEDVSACAPAGGGRSLLGGKIDLERGGSEVRRGLPCRCGIEAVIIEVAPGLGCEGDGEGDLVAGDHTLGGSVGGAGSGASDGFDDLEVFAAAP